MLGEDRNYFQELVLARGSTGPAQPQAPQLLPAPHSHGQNISGPDSLTLAVPRFPLTVGTQMALDSNWST